MNSHILLIDCSDRKGLVYSVTKVLYDHDVNIIRNGEFVDHEKAHFFMRTEFFGAFDSGKLIDDLKKELPENARIRLTGKRKKNIVVLATKEHHCLGDLLIRNEFGDLNAQILAVISNHEKLRRLTEQANVPYHYISHENLSREDHENKVLGIIEQYNPEYIVLAKYMRVLTPAFIKTYPERIINIHHSFLPAFIGANPYKQAYNRGVKIIGATAHFVNENLDEGPIIAQNVIPVDHTYDDADMATAGRDVEKNVLSHALKLVFDEKVMVTGNKTIIFD
ncbi:MAG: formyltetrahydrofolate deformylase [Spirochaetota bacterium]